MESTLRKERLMLCHCIGHVLCGSRFWINQWTCYTMNIDGTIATLKTAVNGWTQIATSPASEPLILYGYLQRDIETLNKQKDTPCFFSVILI